MYAIKDWAKFYEVSDSRKVEGPLSWVAVRTKQDGFGFRRLASHRKSCELFSAFVLMVQIAARLPRGERGILVRDGRPLNAKSLATMTGFPAPAFEMALEFFCDPEQGWMETVALPDTPASPANSANPDAPGVTAPPATTTPPVRIPPDASGVSGYTVQDSTVQDKTVGGMRSPRPVDDEASWLKSLAIDEAYRGIDVNREFAKMKVWCLTRHRQPTRRRFVNWLNRCEKPLSSAPAPASQRITTPKRYTEEGGTI